MSQYTIDLKEFASRRAALAKKLSGAVGLVLAGEAMDPHGDAFHPHKHFAYLTGITNEPGAALLIEPNHPIKSRREMLFLRPLNPEVEKWDGLRDEIASTLRTTTGFATIFRLDKLPMFLADAARRARTLACLHPLAHHDQPVSPDLAIFRKVQERIPGVTIEERSMLINELRSVKSKAEVAMIEQAIAITAIGFDAALRALRPGMTEFALQEEIEHAYRLGGARELAFGSIVGSGINSTVLHYRANDQIIGADDLVCIDSGAKVAGYSADITRTLPASGTFNQRQREVYNVVLTAQNAAIKAVKPGATIAQVDHAAREVIRKAGFADYFIHGIGHHLGLDTHDANPDMPLKAGNVITIEPGIYIPAEKLGVRIEDDVLVTPRGAKNLSSAIPKAAKDIEALIAKYRKK
jgi:Xaa-Pro aminopeptidase